MRFQRPPRPLSVLSSVLAAVGIMFAIAGCSHIAPLGPIGIQFPPPRQLGSPIVVQVMRLQPPAGTAGCPPGWVAVSLPAGGGPRVSTAAVPAAPPQRVSTTAPAGSGEASAPPSSGPSLAPPTPAFDCYRPVSAPVTITSAAISSFMTFFPPPGQTNAPDLYGFIVAVPSTHLAAVAALVRQAYDSRSVVGISVAGKLWQAPMVFKPFPGQRLEIALLSKNQAHYLYRLLVPSG